MPLFTYGAELFEHRLQLCRSKVKLSSVRGVISRAIIGAYRTTSTEAAAVLANIPPIEELIYEYLDTSRHRKCLEIRRGTWHIEANPRLSKRALKEQLKERTINTWQEQWSDAETGRGTFQFLPDVFCRQSINISCNKRTVQMLTGHGQFKIHYQRIGKSTTASCDQCGSMERDDPIHRIFHCKHYLHLRQEINSIIGDHYTEWSTHRTRGMTREELPSGAYHQEADSTLQRIGPRLVLQLLSDVGNIDFLAEFVG
ncbi:hypothetical protein HUJ05_009746 [Dendroctonus ponderosae]|nr:hypothetical protein HUJ05_009746 [Dendroctonus ponderosae]